MEEDEAPPDDSADYYGCGGIRTYYKRDKDMWKREDGT